MPHTRTSILASLPSIAEKMRNIKPDVPDPMMEAAKGDAGQMYLLKQASVLDQQNVIMGDAMDKLYSQALETNGRLNTMEPKVERHDRYVDGAESRVKNRQWDLKYLWIPVLLVCMQAVLHKLGLL